MSERACFLTPDTPGVGRGARMFETVPAPLAGAEWLWQVPSGYYWRIVSALTPLVTSAQAANRFPGYQITDQDGNQLVAVSPNNQVVASKSATVCALLGLTFNGATESNVVNTGLPNILLPTGYHFGSLTPGKQTEDAYGVTRLWIEQFEDRGAQEYASYEHTENIIIALTGGQ